MDPASKRLPREVFLQAAEIDDPDHRTAYLNEACAGDPDLRQRVEKLLALEAGAGGPPPEPSVSASISTEPALGTRIGHYQLLEQIGEGGCGVVFMAEQQAPIRRKVALKIIKLGMDTKQVVARFEAERQTLALMDHPNIARVIDAGAADTGRPYFVMELVRGRKITDYCDEHQLSTRERLDLFMQVCHAVQHAHQKGIIHRDLKPSNVLVTEVDGKPVPKVIDFGIAKAIEGRLTDNTLFTAFEQLVGTPSYMSPEQAALVTADIDTRTDIYSLGVMLYQLLTGETPFDTKALLATGLDEMRRTIQEVVPVRPSTRLTAEQSSEHMPRSAQSGIRNPESAIDTDLDWIVMKCLEKERSRRYETANGLAMDVQRHLNNEPIVARPPSRVYEFQKTVRRHWVGFASTAAVILVLALGLAGVFWQWNRAAANERLAVANEWLARQNAYVADMNLAQQSLEEGDLGTALNLLNKHRPEQASPASAGSRSSKDLRGWEWRYLWGLCQGDEEFILHRYPSWVGGISVSADGTTLAVQTSDRVALWDLASHQEITNLPASGFQGTVAFSPTGTLLAAANAEPGREPEVVLWDLRDPSTRTSLPHEAPVISLAFSGDGRFLATMDGWEAVRVWNVGSRSLLTNSVILGTRGRGWIRGSPAAGAIRFSPDGSMLAYQKEGSALRVRDWQNGIDVPVDMPTLALSRDDPLLRRITSLAVSSSGLLAWGVGNGTIYLWDMVNKESAGELLGHSDSVLALTFTRDGQRLASGSGDQTIRTWDISERRELSRLRGHENEVWALAFQPDGETLISGGRDGSVRFWDVTIQEAAFADRVLPIFNPEFTQDGRYFVALDLGSGSISLWDSRTLERIKTFTEFGSGNENFGLSPNDQWVAVAPMEEAVVHVWDWPTMQLVTNLAIPAPSGGVGFLPDNKALWARYPLHESSYRKVGGVSAWRQWRTASWEEIEVDWVKPYVAGAANSADGRLVAIGYETGEIEVRSFPDGGLIASLPGYASSAGGLEFSPDGSRLGSFSPAGFVKLWDLETQAEPMELRSRFRQVSMAFTPDGKRLVVGNMGDAVQSPELAFWDLATRRELITLHGAAGKARFSPDGNLILAYTRSVDVKGFRVWRAPSWEEIETAERAARPNPLP